MVFDDHWIMPGVPPFEDSSHVMNMFVGEMIVNQQVRWETLGYILALSASPPKGTTTEHVLHSYGRHSLLIRMIYHVRNNLSISDTLSILL